MQIERHNYGDRERERDIRVRATGPGDGVADQQGVVEGGVEDARRAVLGG